jgi:hypothetical protein
MERTILHPSWLLFAQDVCAAQGETSPGEAVTSTLS